MTRAVHVVWELTLACNLGCAHCGSRAGLRRPDELSTEECLAFIDQLPGVGTRHVTLIGGEAFLRPDWLRIIEAITAVGIECSLQSGGFHLTAERLRAAAEAGLSSLGISLDGPAPLHDELRGRTGSFDAAVAALRAARALDLPISVNTQITTPVVPHLRGLVDLLVELGVHSWQVQLTVPAGRAADRPDLIVQPSDLVTLMPLLADLFRSGAERGLSVQVGNNVGFFGPFEGLLRGLGRADVHYAGCDAGLTGFGIEANGVVKGCPSLSTELFAAGSVRHTPLPDLVRASQVRTSAAPPGRSVTGLCRGCYYADVCEGGCTWMASSLTGRAGDNPYCHHRALDLAAVGLRERVHLAAPAPGRPFDHARYDVVVEEIPTDDGPGQVVTTQQAADRLAGLGSWDFAEPSVRPSELERSGTEPDPPRALPVRLAVCGGCDRHVRPEETTCPHCRRELAAAAELRHSRLVSARQAERALVGALAQARVSAAIPWHG